jgi:hypothetical protein
MFTAELNRMQNNIFNNDGKGLVLKKVVKISRKERKEKRISSIENPDCVFSRYRKYKFQSSE